MDEIINAIAKFDHWLGIRIHKRFQLIVDCRIEEDPDYENFVIPYLKLRGIHDERTIRKFVQIDLQNLAHALTLLFESNHRHVLSKVLPMEAYSDAFKKIDIKIDHVGRELLGPLSFYLNILKNSADKMELSHVSLPSGPKVTPEGNKIFPSTQTVEALRQFDPYLEGVTICRIFFIDRHTREKRNLELFQASSEKGFSPQHYTYTLARLAILQLDPEQIELINRIEPDLKTGFVTPEARIPIVSPICHLSVQVEEEALIFFLHNMFNKKQAGKIKTYLDEPSSNKADNSFNTKLLACETVEGHHIYNKLLEMVYYYTDQS